MGVDHDEIQTESDAVHSQMSLTQNISSSDPFLAINRALEALAQIQNEVQIPPELLSQINRLNQNRFIDSQSQHSLVFSPEMRVPTNRSAAAHRYSCQPLSMTLIIINHSALPQTLSLRTSHLTQ